MPKTKAVKSEDNEVTKKVTARKAKNAGKEIIENEESGQLTARAEKRVKETTKVAAKKINVKTTNEDDTGIKVSSKAVSDSTEVDQAALGANDIESGNGKKTRGRTSKKIKAAAGKEQADNVEAVSIIQNGHSLPQDIEARRMRLKILIGLGKERGYLTYAEINDHLPDDMLDTEQIEGIISMINDMGISVHDEAPDAETLLMSDATTTVADEDVAEEAEAALSTVDSEFGRTTDPVRMYMREMGSVGLLTRESEIEIAKRIEGGLRHMIQAISACPPIIAGIVNLATEIEKDNLRIDEVVDVLLDADAQVIIN